jgi:cytochrome P450
MCWSRTRTTSFLLSPRPRNFGQGLLTSEGEFWRRQRRLAAPAFHAQRLAGYGETTVRYSERMIESWRPGELRDAHADVMALTLGIAAKALFDAEVERDVAEIGQAFSAIVEEIAVRSAGLYAVGGGPRICIGNRFAMMEAVLILATVAQRFKLEWQSDRSVVPLPSITLRPKGGIWVKPVPRAASAGAQRPLVSSS